MTPCVSVVYVRTEQILPQDDDDGFEFFDHLFIKRLLFKAEVSSPTKDKRQVLKKFPNKDER